MCRSNSHLVQFSWCLLFSYIKSPAKSSSLDPVPTFLLREFIDLLLPFVTRLVNTSLHAGRLPVSQRHAIVTLLLKKPGLGAANMANYRPVFNLSFISKVAERAVAIQLNEYLVMNDLLPRYLELHDSWPDPRVGSGQKIYRKGRVGSGPVRPEA